MSSCAATGRPKVGREGEDVEKAPDEGATGGRGERQAEAGLGPHGDKWELELGAEQSCTGHSPVLLAFFLLSGLLGLELPLFLVLQSKGESHSLHESSCARKLRRNRNSQEPETPWPLARTSFVSQPLRGAHACRF